MIKCSICGVPLEGEEIDSPYKDENDEPICDDCWDEVYRITCCLCENGFDKREWGYFAVPQEGYEGVIGVKKSGIYKIVEWPFYVASVVTGVEIIWSDRVQWIADIPEDCKEIREPYEVCSHCVKSALTNKSESS